MDNQINNKNKPTSKPPKGFLGKNIYWIYLLLMGMFFAQYFVVSNFGAKEITWNQFEKEMLATDEVQLLEVVNKEEVRIYIKKDKLEQEKYETSNKIESAPQFFMEIGSVEVFEQKLATEKDTYEKVFGKRMKTDTSMKKVA